MVSRGCLILYNVMRIQYSWLVINHYLLNFTRSWAFGFFKGISGFKVKLHHFEQPARRRVARKSVECRWFVLNQGSNGETGLPEKLKQSETVGNSRKQSETAGNSRKQSGAARHDQAKIVNPHCFLQEKNPGNPLFFLKVQRETVGNSWKQLETVGARTFDSAEKGL